MGSKSAMEYAFAKCGIFVALLVQCAALPQPAMAVQREGLAIGNTALQTQPDDSVKSPATWRDVLNHLERVFER